MINTFQKIVDNIYFRYYLLQLKKDQWRNPQEVRSIQLRKLKAIVRHAYSYVPYYHRLFDSAKIKPEDIKDQDDLRKIPMTTKKALQKNHSDAITRGVDVSKQISEFTTGSTGVPLKIVMDRAASNYVWASAEYPFVECGVRPTDNFVTIFGRAQSIKWSKKYSRILRNISETIVPTLYNQETLINILQQIDPDVIFTFPSVLTILSNYSISGITPRMIFTQGETVTEHCRDVVKRVFGLEVHDTYGSVESCARLAFECNEHRGLHMITDGAYIEFVDEEGEPTNYGEQGEVIVTALHNYAMPLIRYRLGDLGISTDEKCPCGRSWPLIKSIQGRTDDYLVLPSGRRISLRHGIALFYEEIIKSNVFCISQYQIIQESKSGILFKVVKGRKFDEKILERIRRSLEELFMGYGESVDVDIQVVDEIPMERTGKRRVLTSMVK